LRNPFRWSFDPPTGRIFIGDVGQDRYEEIDIVNKGDDLGWSWREGLHAFTSGPAPTNPPAAPNPGDPPGTGFKRVDPIYEYDHTNDGIGNDAVVYGQNVTGGVVYRGNRLTELYGAYLFAEYQNGQIVALREQANGTWTGTRLATNSGIVDFGTDPRNGDVIFCNLNSSTVRRLLRTGTSGTNPPALLSQTGAFSNLANLTPQPGIVDYEPNVAFWSDYAIKSRWFSIKNLTDTVGFSADGKWTLPTGMVWVKHFDIETTRGNPATRRKLETRFLVKTATDVYGLCYKWRVDQTDADLVGEEGLSELIPSSSPAQTWRYPSRTECRVCHTAVAGFALSFNTRQINRAHTFGAQTQNQITALSVAGYFTSPPANVNTLPAFAPADDNGRSLEHRVRSYLAVNCVQCHQPGGTATGNWDARPTTPTDAANLIGGVLVNNDGDSANRWAVKGDTAHSMVLKRLQGNGVPRMPPLATNELDLTAIQLLTDWITLDLPTRQSLAEWQTANFGSPTAPNAAPGADPDNDGLRNDFEFLARSSPLNSTERWSLGVQTVGLNYQLTFPQIANRGIVIETGTDLQTWVPWDVPGNAPIFSATTQPRTLVGPMTGPQRFFRARFSEE
jgi:mono/diheme cytochrome c family protein